jgi:hypothetical protein
MTSHRRSDEDFAMTTKLLPARHAAHRPADDVGAGRHTPPTPPTPPDDRRRLERIWRSPADQPRWARPALLSLLALTAVLYLWDLSASGYANSFYAAAVQAGTKSWKAFFFGSLDAGNSITVDKPPASLWVMELSGRIFGRPWRGSPPSGCCTAPCAGWPAPPRAWPPGPRSRSPRPRC